jgi:acyl carrier protein
LIDSIQLLNLVAFLQQRFGVSVRPEAMLPENFATVNALVALVHRSEKVQA